ILGHTVRWAISHRPNSPLAALQDRNGAERCATRWAPRPAPLLHRAPRAQMPPGLCSLLDEPRGSDHLTPLAKTFCDMERELQRFADGGIELLALRDAPTNLEPIAYTRPACLSFAETSPSHA